VVARPTGRAVCLALTQALERFGIPDEPLTGNGKQFTARFGRGGEVLFDRFCRENGITHRLTRPNPHHDRQGRTLPPDPAQGTAQRPHHPPVRSRYSTPRAHQPRSGVLPPGNGTARSTESTVSARAASSA
jgi:transposase InsO family protein